MLYTARVLNARHVSYYVATRDGRFEQILRTRRDSHRRTRRARVGVYENPTRLRRWGTRSDRDRRDT